MNVLIQKQLNGVKTLAMSYGIIVGLTAIVHGFFETLQGNKPIETTLIEAISPYHRLWEYGTLHAVSYLPTYFLTGITAMIMGIIIILWSIYSLERKFGALILLILVILTFLVGGGYGVPITIGMLASIASMMIKKKLSYLNAHLSPKIKKISLKTWPGSLILFIAVFVGTTTLSIIGWPLIVFIGVEATNSFTWLMAIVMVILMTLAFCNSILVTVAN